MSKTNKTLIAAVVVLAAVIIGLVVWKVWPNKSYYGVYLRTGDLYFGELVRFPSFGLKQVYLLQVNQQNQQNPISLQRFNKVFWGPEDFLKINKDEVVWTAKLSDESELVKVFTENPDLQATQQQPTTSGETGTSPAASNPNSGASQPKEKN
jgi:hypothetical protein